MMETAVERVFFLRLGVQIKTIEQTYTATNNIKVITHPILHV